MRDLERALGRLSQVSGNARDLVALQVSLAANSRAEKRAAKAARATRVWCESDYDSKTVAIAAGPASAKRAARNCPELAGKTRHALVDDPPLTLKEGGIFRDGFRCRSRRIAPRLARREKLDQPNCRSAKSPPPGSSRSRFGSIPSSAISSRSRNRTSPTCPRITRASKPRSAASVSSRPS